MTQSDGQLRATAFEAYESIPSLDPYGELIRLILTEVSLLTEKYRHVRRHDIPHIRELSGLLDVLWQEIEMGPAPPAAEPKSPVVVDNRPLFGAGSNPRPDPDPAPVAHKPIFHTVDFDR